MADNSTKSERTTLFRGSPVALDGPELKAGDVAPDFEAVTSSMAAVNLAGTGKGVRIFSVVPSLDTPVCDAQTKRFEDEAGKMNDIKVFAISMDLPFAQQRWCGNFGINHTSMVSDHISGSFGQAYGTLIRDLRIESRAIFVVGPDDRICYAEYVRSVGDFPDYESALLAARNALTKSAAS